MIELRKRRMSCVCLIRKSRKKIKEMSNKLAGLFCSSCPDGVEDKSASAANTVTAESGISTDELPSSDVTQRLVRLEEELKTANDNFSRMIKFLAETNTARIRRLEEGYDYKIVKGFALQIIDEIRRMEKRLESEECAETRGIIEETIDSLNNLLDKNSVTVVEPAVGDRYEDVAKVAEVLPEKVATDNPSLTGMVAEVVKKGYSYEFGDGNTRMLACAKVKLYACAVTDAHTADNTETADVADSQEAEIVGEPSCDPWREDNLASQI